MSPSCAALCLSVRTLVATNASIFFWTFTFEDAIDFKEASRRWNYLNTVLQRKYKGIQGVRVYELHGSPRGLSDGVDEYGDNQCSGTHGIHVHCLINQYLPIEELRKIAKVCRFGRIHVAQATDLSSPERLANYLAKYLRKAQGTRPKGLKGFRLWGAIGKWQKTKVIDIKKDTPFKEFYYHVKALVSPVKTLGAPQKHLNFSRPLPYRLEVLRSLSAELQLVEVSDAPAKVSRGIRYAFIQSCRTAYQDSGVWDWLLEAGWRPRKTIIINV